MGVQHQRREPLPHLRGGGQPAFRAKRNVTLFYGKTDRNGGAILNNGILIVSRSTLRNNEAHKHGGAIFNNGTLSATSVTFRNNQAGGSGGAIRNKAAMTVSSGTFLSNRADSRGGAIRHDGPTSKARLSNNRFTGNSPQNCVGVDCGDIPALDPNLPTLAPNIVTKPYSLPEGDAVQRFQLRLLDEHKLSFRVTATGAGMVPAMTIWRDGREQAKASNGRGLHYAELNDIELGPGYYHVVVWTVSGGGEYVVQVASDDLPEPYDAPEPEVPAERISYGETKTGFLDGSSDVNRFVFSAAAGDTVDISLRSFRGALFRPHLKLLNDSGGTMRQVREGSQVSEIAIANYRIGKSGDYTISVENLDVSQVNYNIYLMRSGDRLEVNDVCTLPDAVRAANSDKLSGGCPKGDGADVIYLAEHVVLSENVPDITSDITVEGGGLSISANNARRVFTIANSGKLTINEVVLTEGNIDPFARLSTNNSGGAIHNSGVLNASNCSFVDNHAGNDGGAIINYGSMTITNCYFVGNHADWGGAIMHKGSYASISSSHFYHNEAKGGGAIFNDDGKQITINSSTFKFNEANNFADIARAGFKVVVKGLAEHYVQHGVVAGLAKLGITVKKVSNPVGWALLAIDAGHIIWEATPGRSANRTGGALVNKGVARISGSRFQQNAADFGGAISSWSTLKILGGSSFHKNAAAFGGAIWVYKESAAIANSSFTENGASGAGGAILQTFAKEDSVSIVKIVAISNSIFRGNAAGKGGAAELLLADIMDSKFIGNKARDGGGALRVEAPSSIRGSEFRNNNGRLGGAIYTPWTVDLGSRPVTVNSSVFHNNSASDAGGAIFLDQRARISNSRFNDNVASGRGGGAIFDDTNRGAVSSSTFSGNSPDNCEPDGICV